MSLRYEIRAARHDDFDGLMSLARHLNSVNLPHNDERLSLLLQHSEASFAGTVLDPTKREYRFVLCDREHQRIVGTSMVAVQLGRRDAPYIYFQVRTDEKYSETLDALFHHEVLTIRYSYNGPTEFGSLVLHPDYRGRPERLGLMVSYIRFLWIAANRDLFMQNVLAELLPPLEPDGTSHLWEAVGRRFTGLTYKEADQLSKSNKEFVRSLFPRQDIFVSLLSNQAQNVIGKVGPATRGVEKILRRQGFTYAGRVDPFDGGPHFMAAIDEVPLVKQTGKRRVRVEKNLPEANCAVARITKEPPYFQAFYSGAWLSGEEVIVEQDVARAIGVSGGEELWTMPHD